MLGHSNAATQRPLQHMPLVGSSSSRQASSRFAALSAGRVGKALSSCSSTRCHHHLAVSSRHRSSRVLQAQQQPAAAVPPICAVAAAAACASSSQHQQQHRQQQQQRGIALAAAASAAAAAAEDEPSSGTQPHPQHHQAHQQQDQQQQQQAGLDLPPLDLPPSRSAALWLNSMSDAELQQAAADWGYTHIGRPLPEGVSLTALAETLPEEVFTLNLTKALGYLALSLGVMALGYSHLVYWHSICPLWQQLLAWVVVGTGYYGVWQTALDCAHFAFWPERPLVQDVVGALLMAPALMSYEVVRLKYFNHIMCTNQLYEDLDAWHPLLPADLAAMPAWQATLTALCMATPLKFLASIGQWARSLEGFDLRLHPKRTRFWVWLSWTLPLGFVGVVWPALVAAGGFGGLVTYWLGPWLVFHAWLSVMSLVQHTGPHITWAEEGLTYDQAQATINGTVNVALPRWLEVLLHHSNHHLPSHLSISIPSYNLPAAQEYLQQRLGQYLTTATLNANLLRNLMTAWLVYNEQQQRYLSFDEAADLVEAARQQQRQEQQQEREQLEQQRRQQQEAAAASSSGGEQRVSGGIEPSIPLEKLLGPLVGANGRSSRRGGGQQPQEQQLAGGGAAGA